MSTESLFPSIVIASILGFSPLPGWSHPQQNVSVARKGQSGPTVCSPETLRRADAIVQSLKGRVGIAVELDDQLLYSHLSGEAFPMQSVFKFPLALAVLNLVDQGSMKLDDPILVSPDEIHSNTWSPMREKYPQGGTIPLKELIRYSVAESDNNACDILFRLVGGVESVQNYLRNKGIADIRICSTEEEMHRDNKLQYANSSTPLAMNILFRSWNSGKMLGKESTRFLKDVLEQTVTGAGRLKEKLPKETVVAHKTGTSDISPEGVVSALNDAGVIRLSEGGNLFISIFVSDCKEDPKEIEHAMAELAFLFYRELSRS